MGPMRTEVLPFTKVPRQPVEKEAGGAGVTTQAGRMQQCATQRSPGKVGGIHGRWDLSGSPLQSARRCIVFIIRDSFQLLRFGRTRSYAVVRGSTIRARLAVGYGVFTP